MASFEQPAAGSATAVAAAIRTLARGGLVLVAPSGTRRCEPHSLVAVGRSATAPIVTTMVREGGGLIRLALTPQRCNWLGLRPEPRALSPRLRADEDQLVTIEARSGVTTGISAADRAATLRVASAEDAGPADVVSPGHVVPVRAADEALSAHSAVADAAVELCRWAGGGGAAALCHVLDEDGDVADGERCRTKADELGIPFVGVVDAVAHARGVVHSID